MEIGVCHTKLHGSFWKDIMSSLIAKLGLNYENHVVCFSNFCLENCTSWDTNWKVPLSYMATAMATGMKILQKTVYETAKGINLYLAPSFTITKLEMAPS